MPYTHEKINKLEGGWYVVYNDGTVITMEEAEYWRKVPNKKDIKIVGLKCRHKHYELVDKGMYIPPGKTELREISIGDELAGGIRITSSPVVGWFIGYYDNEKKVKVLIRGFRATGKFQVEEEPYK